MSEEEKFLSFLLSGINYPHRSWSTKQYTVGGLSSFTEIYLPKQFPLCGMNILQAVAIGNSAETSVFIMTSSIRSIIAEIVFNNN